MAEEMTLSFFYQQRRSGRRLWYVLTRLKPSLDKLSTSIDNLHKDTNKRLDALENGQRQFQMQIHELKVQVDSIRHGDS